jgi:two-component system sensor kinase FixL
MHRITQRQATIALLILIFVGDLLFIISNWLQPENPLASQRGAYFIYLLITAVLIVIAWFDWPFVRHLTILLITLIIVTVIPDEYIAVYVPQGILLPVILAMVITNIPGMLATAVFTWLLFLWRTDGSAVFLSPQAISTYILAVSGLVLGRMVINVQLAHEQDLLQALMDNFPDTIYFKDKNSRFTRINRAQAQVLGIDSPAAAIGKTDSDYLTPALSQEFLTEEQQMMQTGIPIIDRVEYNPLPGGQPRWFSATKAPICDKNGRIIGMVGISRDITERMLMETALQQSEQNYRQIFNTSSEAIFIHNAQNGAILDVNNQMLEMYGYSYAEAIMSTIAGLSSNTPPYTQEEAAIRLQKAVNEGPQLFEWQAKRKNSSLFWVEVSLRSAHIGGKPCVLAVVRDISKRKEAETALRLSEERFAKAFRFSPDSVTIATLDGQVIDANEGFTDIFGYTQEEIQQKTFHSLDVYANPADRAQMIEQLQAHGEVRELEIIGRRKSGATFDALLSAATITLHGQECLVAIVRDITERKQAAAALQAYARELERSNRELEQFAHAASHDLQEPLRKVQTFSHLLITRYNDQIDARGQDYLHRMTNAAERMQTLIQDLLSYARVSSQGKPFVPVDLTAVAQQVLSDLEIRLQTTNGRVQISPLPTIEADPTQMHQLLLNLIGNALKFHKPQEPPIVQIHSEIIQTNRQPPMLQLTITDNGIGFDEAYLPTLFTMFQRLHSREQYEGSGIGLAICRRIIERHNGNITASSIPNQGATFTILLPLTQPNP